MQRKENGIVMCKTKETRKTVENNRESITDIGWYFNNIIQNFFERGCPIDSIKFEEYVD